MRIQAILGGIAVLFGACSSPAPSTPEELEAALRSRARSVVHEADFVLYSPYDEPCTAEYASVLREQALLVRRLLADAGGQSLRIYLVLLSPGETGAGEQEHAYWVPASANGFGGGAVQAGFVFVYVRDEKNASSAWMHAFLSRVVMRHELAHVCARRAGLARSSWFNEGLAEEIECMREEGSDLHPSVFPSALIVARKAAHSGSVDELLGWNVSKDPNVEHRGRRYAESQALVRFLLERQSEGDWLQRVRAVHALEDQQVVELEPAWIAWLSGLDALAAIRRGTQSASASASERTESAARLPVLAEQGAVELFTPAADALALDLLSNPDTSNSAATFLLYFRARALTDADVARLVDSEDPARCLTGIALRARRDEPVDLPRARQAWNRVLERDRTMLTMQQQLIPGLLEQAAVPGGSH